MSLYDFLNSNFFQTLAVLTGGYVAYRVYEKQKSDIKRNAATAVLLEIQNAEKIIVKVRETVRTDRLEIDVKVLQSDSWNKYKHLFSNDFDDDEWTSITEFYNKAHLLDDAIRYNNAAFASDAEQIRVNRQKVLAGYAADLVTEASKNAETKPEMLLHFDQKVQAFDRAYMDKQTVFGYKPMKPVNDAKIYLEDLRPMMTTSVGQKLKSLVGPR